MNKKYLNQSVKTSLCALLIAPLAVLADGGNDAKWEFGVGAATRVLGKTKFYGGIDSSAFESALGARSGGFSLPGDLGDQTQGSVDRNMMMALSGAVLGQITFLRPRIGAMIALRKSMRRPIASHLVEVLELLPAHRATIQMVKVVRIVHL